MSEQVVVELVVDARGTKAGTAEAIAALRASERAATRDIEVHEKLTAARERAMAPTVRLAENVNRLSRDYARLVAAADPVIAMNAKIAAAERTTAMAFRHGVTTQDQANATLALYRRRLEEAYTARSQLAAAERAGTDALHGAGDARMAAQMGNAAFRDAIGGLSAGQGLATVASQQVPQFLEALAAGGGGMAGLSATLTSLISPMNLAIVGFTTLAGVAINFFSSSKSGAERATEALALQEAHLRALGDAFEKAGGQQAAMMAMAARPSRVSLQQDLIASTRALEDARKAFGPEITRMQSLVAALNRAAAMTPENLTPTMRRNREDLNALLGTMKQLRDGGAPEAGREFMDILVGRRAELAGFLGDVDKLGAALILAGENAEKSAAGLRLLGDKATEADYKLLGLVSPIEKLRKEALDRALLKSADAMSTLQGLIPDTRTELVKLADAYRAANAAAMGGDEVLRNKALFDRAQAGLNKRAGDSADDVLRRARDAAAQVGLSPLQRQLAEIDTRFRDLRRENREFPGALATLGQAEELERAARIREATLGPLADGNRLLAEQNALLDVQIATWGKSTGEVTRAVEFQKLVNAAQRDGINVTDELRRKYLDLATGMGNYAQRSEDASKAQQRLVQDADAVRGNFRSLAGDVAHGIAERKSGKDILRGVLGKLGNTMMDRGLDDLTRGLFGKEGGPLGGLLGPMFSKGGPDGTAGNPLHVTLSGSDGLGGLLGIGKPGSVTSSPLPPPYTPTGAVPGLDGVTYGGGGVAYGGSGAVRGPVAGASGVGALNNPYTGPLDSIKRGADASPLAMYQHLLARGASRNEALMLTGAAANESEFDASVWHDSGQGYGLFGHNLGRLDMRGKGWQQQADAALAELRRRPESSMVASAQTPEDLARAQMFFEQPQGFTPRNPGAGHNYAGRVNTLRYFSQLGGGAQVNPLANVPGATAIMGQSSALPPSPSAVLPLQPIEMAQKFDTMSRSMNGLTVAADKTAPALDDASKGFGDMSGSLMGLGSMLGSKFGGAGGAAAGGLLGKILGLFVNSVFGGGANLFADGGIATPGGPLNLPRFASGGISDRPSIFAEAGIEAAVPLPDGRSIPVSFRGSPIGQNQAVIGQNAAIAQADKDSARSGAPVYETTSSMHVNIDARGAQEGVAGQIHSAVTSALKAYDKHLNRTVGRKVANAQGRGW